MHPAPAPSPNSLSRVRERVGVRAVDKARNLRSSSTDAERTLWKRLRNRQILNAKFRRQFPVGPFIADFACVELQLIVELDGGQHFSDDGIAADRQRTQWLNERGWTVLRFGNDEPLTQIEAVLQVIANWVADHRPSPQPSPASGRGS
jgi:very-short-patch-repair endonuclease